MYEAKKKYNKELLLDKYIYNLQRKKLDRQDNRLLEVLGFQETLKLLTEQ